MKRIKLIVTGDLEKLALASSLSRFFPSKIDASEVMWETPRKVHGATSYPLRAGTGPSAPMMELAKAMISEVRTGRNGTPADLVIVIDDVEVGNLGNEAVIAQHFRRAVQNCIEQCPTQGEQQRLVMLVRERCSFHLVKPMIESYFFGYREALVAAGTATTVAPRLASLDLEQFETKDTEWLIQCQLENLRHQQRNPWWRHECHPKHYLDWLVQQNGKMYEETEGGQHALRLLNWLRVPRTVESTPLIRALFEDLSEWFGVKNPLGVGIHNAAFFPTLKTNRASLLLRNL